MSTTPIMQCDKRLDFSPRAPWSPILPPFSWRGVLLCGFERTNGFAVDLAAGSRASFVEAFTACHPALSLSELARLQPLVDRAELEPLFSFYGLRWSQRLAETLAWLRTVPAGFQTWVDEKKLGPRDLAPLQALPRAPELDTYLTAFVALPLSRSLAVRALENAADLRLLGHEWAALLPAAGETADAFAERLETWRRPRTAQVDENWRREVALWPWPAQVQGEWRRSGDQAGLEIKLRANSAQDLKKKLDRLHSIGDAWSCKN